MILGLKTAESTVTVYIYKEDGGLLSELVWDADRELARGLLKKIEDFLEENDIKIEEISGLIGFEGPGSFTGLRIGLTVLNTLAYAQNIPIIGARGDGWQENAIGRLLDKQNDRLITPFYGAEPRVTQPKK